MKPPILDFVGSRLTENDTIVISDDDSETGLKTKSEPDQWRP